MAYLVVLALGSVTISQSKCCLVFHHLKACLGLEDLLSGRRIHARKFVLPAGQRPLSLPHGPLLRLLECLHWMAAGFA